jgi:hypothetical protein
MSSMAQKMGRLLTIKEASEWSSDLLGKNVTPSNIAYLIQYGRVRKICDNGATQIDLSDLTNYYRSYNGSRETNFRARLNVFLAANDQYNMYLSVTKEDKTTHSETIFFLKEVICDQKSK